MCGKVRTLEADLCRRFARPASIILFMLSRFAIPLSISPSPFGLQRLAIRSSLPYRICSPALHIDLNRPDNPPAALPYALLCHDTCSLGACTPRIRLFHSCYPLMIPLPEGRSWKTCFFVTKNTMYANVEMVVKRGAQSDMYSIEV